jgi:excinuclease ABC subunit A
VVEHDPDMINSSDYIIDIGPKAGEYGGEIVYSGELKNIKKSDSITSKYLSGKMKIETPSRRRPPNGRFISVIGAAENNLKDIDVRYRWEYLPVLLV